MFEARWAEGSEGIEPRIRGRRSGRAIGNRGFTFIELLIVIATVAALSGIAIQALAGTRGAAYDSRARHDLAAVVRAEMARFAETGSYLAIAVTGPAKTDVLGAAVSATVTLEVEPESPDSFKASAVSSLGTGKVFKYDSVTGVFTIE